MPGQVTWKNLRALFCSHLWLLFVFNIFLLAQIFYNVIFNHYYFSFSFFNFIAFNSIFLLACSGNSKLVLLLVSLLVTSCGLLVTFWR